MVLTKALRTLRPRVSVANLQTARVPAKVTDKFYLTGEWIALRDRVRREAGGRCQAPGCGRIEQRMFVDHRVELKDGGEPLDRRNVWLLCGSCHSLKTAAERVKRTAELVGGGQRTE
jgi:5-methylcytosine-specific restriction protein A